MASVTNLAVKMPLMNASGAYPNGANRVSVIRAIRIICGDGLKEAKDRSENPEIQNLRVVCLEGDFQEQVKVLRANGVQVHSGTIILAQLKEMKLMALESGETVLAEELDELITAQSLRVAGR